jgi:hypothetical protein
MLFRKPHYIPGNLQRLNMLKKNGGHITTRIGGLLMYQAKNVR